jgi:glucokinase
MSRGTVLCVDIGGTSTKIGLSGPSGKIELLDSIPSRGPANEYLDALSSRISRTLAQLTAEYLPVVGIGVAVAGFLDDNRTRLIYNSNLTWLEHAPLRDRLSSDFNIPVELEVDSNAAAIAEYHRGVGVGSRRFLCLAVGTGFGVGMIIDGKPLRFAYGCMGDPGHIIVQPNGPLCTCGGRGCAEIFVSAPVLAEEYRVRSHLEAPQSLRSVIEAARTGDPIALEILTRAGEWLGIAAASLANTFFPDRIAFAGGLAEAGEPLLNGVRRTFEEHAGQFARDQVTMHLAVLGAMATITGTPYLLSNSDITQKVWTQSRQTV